MLAVQTTRMLKTSRWSGSTGCLGLTTAQPGRGTGLDPSRDVGDRGGGSARMGMGEHKKLEICTAFDCGRAWKAVVDDPKPIKLADLFPVGMP